MKKKIIKLSKLICILMLFVASVFIQSIVNAAEYQERGNFSPVLQKKKLSIKKGGCL